MQAAEVLHPIAQRMRKELKAVEFEALTRPITLTDLMREGSMFMPQAVGGWWKDKAGCVLATGFMAAWARGFVSLQ